MSFFKGLADLYKTGSDAVSGFFTSDATNRANLDPQIANRVIDNTFNYQDLGRGLSDVLGNKNIGTALAGAGGLYSAFTSDKNADEALAFAKADRDRAIAREELQERNLQQGFDQSGLAGLTLEDLKKKRQNIDVGRNINYGV